MNLCILVVVIVHFGRGNWIPYIWRENAQIKPARSIIDYLFWNMPGAGI